MTRKEERGRRKDRARLFAVGTGLLLCAAIARAGDSGSGSRRGLTVGPPLPSGRTMILAGYLRRLAVVYPISRRYELEGRALINWVAQFGSADHDSMPRQDWEHTARVEDVLESPGAVEPADVGLGQVAPPPVTEDRDLREDVPTRLERWLPRPVPGRAAVSSPDADHACPVEQHLSTAESVEDVNVLRLDPFRHPALVPADRRLLRDPGDEPLS